MEILVRYPCSELDSCSKFAQELINISEKMVEIILGIQKDPRVIVNLGTG